VTGGPVKRRFFWVLNHTLNPLTARLARSAHGPFSLVRHIGRKTGTVYETPVILARVPAGFVAELTYGPDVSWYRNISHAGHCVIVYHGAEHDIDAIEPYPTADGLRAFGNPRSLVLRALRRHEFRLLRESATELA